MPDSLQAEVIVGAGVVLRWVDRSANETHFEIGRGLSGQLMSVIGSVPANVTTFTDSLRDTTGTYYYRVRAGNALGYSGWTLPANADYRMCSSGVVPLCLTNSWDYAVDSAGYQFTVRRQVANITFVEGMDYYQIQEFELPSGMPRDLYYLRNQSGFGCYYQPAPIPVPPAANLMFRYPAYDGDYFFAEGDCVLVTNGVPGIALQVNGTTYTGVIGFQRFFSPQRTVKYWLKPNEIGILREDEYLSPPYRLEARRQLLRYRVLN